MDAEVTALRLSLIGGVAMGVLGVGFALLTRSDAIMLDGFFSVIGFVMGLITLRVARLVKQPGDEQFHFGYILPLW